MNELYLEYNPEAIQDGLMYLCLSFMDVLIQAFNYNENANVDNELCMKYVYGCTRIML